MTTTTPTQVAATEVQSCSTPEATVPQIKIEPAAVYMSLVPNQSQPISMHLTLTNLTDKRFAIRAVMSSESAWCNVHPYRASLEPKDVLKLRVVRPANAPPSVDYLQVWYLPFPDSFVSAKAVLKAHGPFDTSSPYLEYKLKLQVHVTARPAGRPGRTPVALPPTVKPLEVNPTRVELTLIPSKKNKFELTLRNVSGIRLAVFLLHYHFYVSEPEYLSIVPQASAKVRIKRRANHLLHKERFGVQYLPHPESSKLSPKAMFIAFGHRPYPPFVQMIVTGTAMTATTTGGSEEKNTMPEKNYYSSIGI